MSQPTRPLLRWHGGKWNLAPSIIGFFPKHRVYVEPYGGAFSVGLRKPRAYAEIWNDLDHELVNLMRVLRDEKRAARLIRELELTPFARAEFEDAYRPARSGLERARRLIIRSFMGFGGDGATGVYRTGFRSKSIQQGTTPAESWASYPQALAQIIERMAGVTIECLPALELLKQCDGAETLFYLDPPYPQSSRKRVNRRPDNGGVYRHEMSEAEHRALLDAVLELQGFVVLSTYPNEIYADALGGWRCIRRAAHADGARDRVELLYINPAAVQALGEGPLFDAADAA